MLPLAVPPREARHPLGPLKQSLRTDGLLAPLVVRPSPDGCFVVLDGRRRLQAIWELLGDGGFPPGETVACHVIPGAMPLRDLHYFLVLNQAAGLSAGDAERIQAAIEEAAQPGA